MASTSTSSVQKSFKYDVFISFRGEDTRKSFVDHLYHALQRKSIITYKDDEKITKGNRISDELIGSIEDSRFYIIVFSKDYASSSWCLDELVKIMECQKTSDQRAYPVFYDVESTEVRNQIGLVGKAFSKLEKDEAAGKWRNALKEGADLAGWELKNTFDGHEAKFIQKIVQEISLELRFIDLSVDEKLVGMENRVKGVVSTLETGSNDVRMIGIKGIGGGGKTTLARAIFDHISRWFEGKSFVENIREVSKASLSGLKKLQKQILSDVLNDQGIKISSVHDGKQMMKKMMCGRKVLVVLDDVDHVEQLDALAGEPSWFKAGSRIIITTRDEQVLVAHRVNLIHNVKLLSDEEAIFLFSRYTFGKEIPKKGYEDHSAKVVRYAAGLPLTIRVLGSFLCGKTDLEWEDALERLKTIPLKDTLEQLELSYIGLETDYKEIFLDVACILKGWEKEKAVDALESCGFHARNGLRVLEQRSLITISGYRSYLGMHDHIEEMGKNIVRRLHPNEPRMHSRLWIPEEIEDILTNDSGNHDAIQCIKWNSISNKTYMRGLGNMKKLRLVDIHGGEGLASQCFSNAVRYLQWDGYSSESLQKSFQVDNLVGLSMPRSKIKLFCVSGERKVLPKLSFLDMSYSDLRTFDLEMTPNIEKLNLAYCHHLGELKMPLGCSKLKALYLTYSGLRNLNLSPTPNLNTLDLEGCRFLLELTMPYQCPKLKVLYLRNLKLMTLNLPPTLNLESLSLENCCSLEELHLPNGCPNLKSLIIFRSSNLSLNLRKINLGRTPDLELLSLADCHDLVELHMPNECPKLKRLNLKNSALRNLNLGSTPDLQILSLEGCHDLVELHMPIECPKLKHLNLENSALRSFNLGSTPDLEILNLEGCRFLLELTMPYQCPKLKVLYLRNLKLMTLNLPPTLNLESLSLENCCSLEELHLPNGCPNLKSLIILRSSNYLSLNLRKINLGRTPDLELLSLADCRDLVELHMPNECPKLKRLNLKNSALRSLNLGSTPDLEVLSLEGCRDLVELHMPNECPKLNHLNLENSALRNLNLGSTPDLEILSLEGCRDLVELHMPNECPKLKRLNLKNSALRSLNLGSTPDLEILSLEGCRDWVELHMPNECPKLKHLKIDNSALRNLNLGSTPDLEILNLEGCRGFVKLHMPNECPKLKHLNLKNSALRNLNLGRTPDLELLSLADCRYLVELHMPNECPKLKHLKIENSALRNLNLGSSPDLEILSLEGCRDLVELHMPNECPKLKHLNLKNSALRNLNLGSTPDLEILNLEGCRDLVELHMPFQCPKLKVLSLEGSELRTLYRVHTPDLETLSLERCCQLSEVHMPNECPKLKSPSLSKSQLRSLNLGLTPYHEMSNIKESPSGCLKLVYLDLRDYAGFESFSSYKQIQVPVGSLHVIAESVDTCPMHSDSDLQKFRFSCLYEEPILGSIRTLGNFISTGLSPITNLESFSSSICILQGLRKLTLEGSLPEVPKDLNKLQGLEELSLLSTTIKHLPDSICMLKNLKLLELNSCLFIEKLPEGLGRLECLEDLNLTSCIRLQDIPKSICDMKRLKCINLSSCLQVKKLPRELRRLECLKELNIINTGINDLPDGIFELEGLHIVASDCFSCMVESPQLKKQRMWPSV